MVVKEGWAGMNSLPDVLCLWLDRGGSFPLISNSFSVVYIYVRTRNMLNHSETFSFLRIIQIYQEPEKWALLLFFKKILSVIKFFFFSLNLLMHLYASKIFILSVASACKWCFKSLHFWVHFIYDASLSLVCCSIIAI